jgi:membrane-bound lytic murein transglycosylase C
VEYLDEGNARVHVDFEQNQVLLEVLVDRTQSAEQRVATLPVVLVETIESKGSQTGIEASSDNYTPVLNRPVLFNQLTKRVGETNADFALRVINNNQPTVRQTTGNDGVERAVLTLNFNLAPDAIRERAKRVQGFVYKYAELYGLYPSLVFAIIHTESYFNPIAQSSANALGLMQLVPEGGGADAFQKVYGRSEIPSAEFLFDPENNIQLGCAYLDIILNSHLNNIGNVLTKQYLAIAAYNTGASNVFKAYDRSGSKPRAIRKIDAMTPQQNYEYLIQNLPYEETRSYLQKVVERSQLYESWGE